MRFVEINNPEELPPLDMVCRTCTEPLTRRRLPDGETFWAHGGTGVRDHEADPLPRAEATSIKQTCDFCAIDEPMWEYHTKHALNMSIQSPNYSGEIETKQISRGRKHGYRRVVGHHAELDATDLTQTRDATPWAVCTGCAEVIELRDVNRLVTRMRRLNPALARVSSKLLKAHNEPFMRSIDFRIAITAGA